MGHADLALGDAGEQLRDAGHDEVADRIEREMVGRNVLEGRWRFQIVEEYDDTYHPDLPGLEKQAQRTSRERASASCPRRR